MDLISMEYLETLEKGLDKRLTINGVSKDYHSYRIPISKLFYNDLNGRIATCIEEYNDTHSDNISTLQKKDINKYNDIISDFIIDSAVDSGISFETTKNDIKNKGQQIPGVILSDGRIIDGNRRFTVLRKLYEETGDPKFSFFEAVCLKAPNENDIDGWKVIKSLELNLQFNVDEKKGYSRIDELVSFYRDVIDKKTMMFDKKSYCFASGLNYSKFQANFKIVNVMLDYLEWRGKPKSFYILKNEKLDGPIEDIARAKAKMSENEWNEKKDTIYQYMTIIDEGDRTRNIRELLKSAKEEGKLYSQVKTELQKPEVLQNVIDYMKLVDKKVDSVEESNKKKEIKKSLVVSVKTAYNDGKYLEDENFANNSPSFTVEKAIKLLNSINIPTVTHLTNTADKDLEEKLNKLKKVIEEIENARRHA